MNTVSCPVKFKTTCDRSRALVSLHKVLCKWFLCKRHNGLTTIAIIIVNMIAESPTLDLKIFSSVMELLNSY